MLLNIPYNRERAVEYARKWALSRNPLFFDFTGRGGNCTNFVSQCIFAGCGVMNYTPTFGWYYRSSDDRAPAWTGVDELYSFLTGAEDFASQNGGTGPYGRNAAAAQTVEIGDVVQLANSEGEFYHTLIISGFTATDILVCAHSDDALDRALSTYNYASLRVIHIDGARLFFDSDILFENILNGVSLPQG
ncbi:MAG: amidase domain-containing protein [Clostridia bacterium]|nr:amidase domain-containing protein [Clostridia bacterium]